MADTIVKGRYDDALEAALEELDEEAKRLHSQRERVKDRERRVRELERTVDSLSGLVSAKKLAEVQPKIASLRAERSVDPEAGSASYRETLNQLLADPDRYWRVAELERALHEKGLNPGTKYLHNTIQRLLHKGLLVKVRRGVYQVNGFMIGLIRQEDFEDGE